MGFFAPDADDRLFRAVRRLAGAVSRYHRASLAGSEHLPAGPALLVGNHGTYGWETPVFMYLLHRATGRVPIGLTDRLVFGRAPLRGLLERLGGVLGTPEHARSLLGAGHLVVCYPGGSREVLKGRAERHRLRWRRAVGFAKVAIDAGVPVVPFAGLGVDDGWWNLGHPPLARRLFGRYAVPLALGLGPLPWPVRLRFVLGAPLAPPREPREALRFKRVVQGEVERLLAGGLDAGTAHRAAAIVR